ncbi:OLC1v1032988C1 [Oldenlandia corymbosa var. corymbosa]|uniref:OLC1v1032988C1 n=1 Tax=Oldenlandia corymbosa var. corymbosa TaxID=529605 RepID=A0AAV1CMI1_OLDCO|nr:OLC1v1032988C1 [Oldenlandia corymbosa var. corymbosa]
MGSITTSTHNNLKNAVIAFLVPLPSILFYLTFLRHFNDHRDNIDSLSPLWKWCFDHPLLLAHVLFFFNVNVLFWLIGTIQSSHWMIDPYWTVIPVLLVHYYASHPLGHEYNVWRSRILILLTWVWSIRLSHNYFRRENWQWGAREDWRFTDMKQQYGKCWWWVSFFAVYLSQQVFLMGICMPMYAVHLENKQMNIWDFIGVAICLSGIVIAYYADTQLYEFVSRNSKLRELDEPVVPNLDKGLWRYSRHPNYFGEQLWWWGLVILAWNLGHGWMFVGALTNTLCLAYVTVLVENRMLKQDYRAEAYRLYQKRTSVWIPWFTSSTGEKDKNS